MSVGNPRGFSFATAQLNAALGIKDRATLREMTRNVFFNAALSVGDLFLSRKMVKRALSVDSEKLKNDTLISALQSKKSGVLLTAHIGSYNTLLALLRELGTNTSLYRVHSNSRWQRILARIYRRTGIDLVTELNSPNRVLKVFQDGGWLVDFLDDPGGEALVECKLFDLECAVSSAAIQQAISYDLPIFFASLSRDTEKGYNLCAIEVDYRPHIASNILSEDIAGLVIHEACSKLERQISQAPEQWEWFSSFWYDFWLRSNPSGSETEYLYWLEAMANRELV